jgi:AIR synthase-related protein
VIGTAQRCAALLAESAAFRSKCDIARVASCIQAAPQATLAFRERPDRILVGDDTAAIPDGDGYLLLAAEGMLPSFLEKDPYFAGFSSVMVNVSDVAAMGGYPLAVVDAYFHAPSSAVDSVLRGMRDACDAFGVPLVGGHTTCREGGPHCLAVAILGRAQRLLTSFGAEPGDSVLLATDMRGAYREGFPFFDAVTGRSAQRLRADLAMLGELAHDGSVHACKDVSNAGIAGTLLMMLEASGAGATLSLDRLAVPAGATLEQWLVTFPSFGFLLSVSEERVAEVCARFAKRGIWCDAVGRIDASHALKLLSEGEEVVLWDLSERPFTGFGRGA